MATLLRKRFPVVFIWVILMISFSQLLMFLLFKEAESSVPRYKGLSNKLNILKFPSNRLNKEEIAGGSLDRIMHKNIETKSIIETPGELEVSRNRIFISRKLEKLKNLKEIEQKLFITFRKPVKTVQITFDPSKVANDARVTGPDDILISVKTTRQYHNTRLEEIRQTWWSLAKRGTFLFTDAPDPGLNKLFDGHLVNTNCKSGHQRSNLCCKMGYELNFFSEHHNNSRWFCHFDDDNYVIFPSLIKLLRQYNHFKPVYLGKPSLQQKMKTWDKHKGNQEVQFWFGTGGAGFCLSQKLVSMMKPYFSGQAFIETCQRIGVPDDCTIGFISEYLLGVQLTKIDSFHSHLEGLENIPQNELRNQVSLSYGYLGKYYNHVKIKGRFDEKQDPSRFKSLHCNLYPQTPWCKPDVEQDKL